LPPAGDLAPDDLGAARLGGRRLKGCRLGANWFGCRRLKGRWLGANWFGCRRLKGRWLDPRRHDGVAAWWTWGLDGGGRQLGTGRHR
jgi:hypothetical protein